MKTLNGLILIALTLGPNLSAETLSACDQIHATCELAGYQSGPSHEFDGKDEDKFCYQPVLSLRPVAGVEVDPALVNACLESIPKPGPPRTAAKRAR